MDRFHRSFIGLMEQSNEGEWVKFEEAQNRLTYVTKYYKDSCDKYYSLWTDSTAEIKVKNRYMNKLRVILECSLVLNIIFGLYLLLGK